MGVWCLSQNSLFQYGHETRDAADHPIDLEPVRNRPTERSVGTGFFLIILAILLVPLGLGVLIGYFIGKAKANGPAEGPSQSALAKAWQEGFDAATRSTAPTAAQYESAPAPMAEPAPPAAGPAPPGPPTHFPPASPGYQQPVRPFHAPSPMPDYPQQVATAAAYQPPRLSPQELAAKRERDQIRNANILLYVAALLMVGTGMLFVAAGFPTVVTISALAIVTTGFYAAGLLLHKNSHRLRSSGTAFSGTGLALYPILALAASTQLWPGSPLPWLVFSVLGSVAFSIAAAVLNSRVVAFLTLPFLLSTGITAGAALRSGMVWSFVFTIVLATIISWFAHERPRWLNNIFVQAFVSTHEYIVPATLVTQAFLFDKISDLQNALVFAATLLYYVTRTALSPAKLRLYYLTAARALFLLTLWQVLRTFHVAGSTIATVMAAAVGITLVGIMLGQQKYAGLLQRSERSERFAANWLRADVGVHAAALIALSIGSESTLNPNMFGKGDWAALNLPLVLTMITFATVILLHQRWTRSTWWGRHLQSPLWFLAAPFWLARSGDANYGAEFFRPEVFWILGLIGFTSVFLARRHQAVPQLALTGIAGTVLYLVTRTHMGVADTADSWQTTTVVVALWLLLTLLWLYALTKLSRYGRVEERPTEAPREPATVEPTAPAQKRRGLLDPALAAKMAQRFTLSHRLIGYAAAAAMAVVLWLSLSIGHARTVTVPGQQQTLYYVSIALVLAIVVSFGLILLRNLRQTPEATSTHLALWGWALVGLAIGVRERVFLNNLDETSVNWFSLVFGLVLVAVVWTGGYYTSRLGTESAQIRARWYQTAAILGLGYALYHGLHLLRVDANLLFGIPFAATLGYFAFQAARDSALTQAPGQVPAGAAPAATSPRYRNHALISAGLLLAMPLFLLFEAGSAFGELSERTLYRALVFGAWLLFTAVVLWYSVRRVFGYLPVAAVGVFGALHVATAKSPWAGEQVSAPYASTQLASWLSIAIGIAFILLMIVPHLRPATNQRWGNAATWAPLAAHLILVFAAIEFHEDGYIMSVAGLGFAFGMVLASHREQAWALRPISVPIIYLSMIPLADELHWDLSRQTGNDVPVWMIAGILGATISYLIGLFYTGGGNGKHAARMMRITALSGFLVFMLSGWLDSKAPLVFAVALTLVAMIGLGLEQRGSTRRTFLEISVLVAILGAQRIWSDVPGNIVDQRMAFWFQQQVVLGLAGLATWTYLRQRKTIEQNASPTQPSGQPHPAVPMPHGYQPQPAPQPTGHPVPLRLEPYPVPSSSTRFNAYLYSAASLLSIAALWLFGMPKSGAEFFFTVAAFVALIVYGAMKSRTGMLIWGIGGTILVLFLFLQVGSFLLLFLLALALMGVGIWQLVRITKRPAAQTQIDYQQHGAVHPHHQPPYNQPGAYYPEQREYPAPPHFPPTDPHQRND